MNQDFSNIFWWPRTGLNRRHGDFQSPALPTELPGHLGFKKALADLTGIEPAVFSVTGRHVNRYTTGPTLIHYHRRKIINQVFLSFFLNISLILLID